MISTELAHNFPLTILSLQTSLQYLQNFKIHINVWAQVAQQVDGKTVFKDCKCSLLFPVSYPDPL